MIDAVTTQWIVPPFDVPRVDIAVDVCFSVSHVQLSCYGCFSPLDSLMLIVIPYAVTAQWIFVPFDVLCAVKSAVVRACSYYYYY